VLAVATGSAPADLGLLDTTARAARRVWGEVCTIRFASARPRGCAIEEWIQHFPLMEWLPGADLVVGPCGYHLCHETAAVGVPSVFVPQQRRYDDQCARAQDRLTARSPEELEAQMRRLAESPAERLPPGFVNGAEEAARLLAEVAA
jgi:predicted glycosyltransferase